MPRNHHHRSDRYRPWGMPSARRALAAALCLLLVFSALAPAWAFAGEAESEGEGSVPPGPTAGLEESPEFEPSGEETALEVEVAAVGEEGEEEAASVESEPPPAPEAAGAELGVEAEPPLAEATPPGAPATPADETGPAYETAPPPPAAVVEGAPLSAPPEAASGSTSSHGDRGEQAANVAAIPEAAPAPLPPEVPERSVPIQPPAAPVEHEGAPADLKGREFHTVRSGESLWSIAAALLPTGASNAQIAAEVQRLWRLNKGRIGTGDPNVIRVGTVLRLR
jgi:resuscitation-promoting factor RpfA